MAELNKNIMIVQEIENLAVQIRDGLKRLDYTEYFGSRSVRVKIAIHQANNTLKSFKELDLEALKRIFE